MIKSLEFLRITAAIFVVLCHLPDFSGINIFKSSPFNGAIGVDIFFIISGVVIGITASKSFLKREWKPFLIKRIFRVFPLYILVTIAYIIATGSISSYSTEDLLLSIFLFPTYSEGSVSDPIVYLGWTLRFEMFFYIATAISIRFNNVRSILSFILLSAIVSNYFWGFYFGELIILEFLIGFMIGTNMDRVEKASSNITLSSKYLFLIFSISVLMVLSTGSDSINTGAIPRMSIDFHGFVINRAIIWGWSSALFVVSVLLLENQLKWKLAFLGKYTYSVYLLQVIAIPLSNAIYPFENGVQSLFMLIIVLSGMSYVSFHFIEAPINRIAKRF
ncbi:acyltransferase family protein [Vibrio parahaemolyticus]|uniref:acyltransferase family protein n=1 Tax=Vibrio parahaemolyticus TaxID=670 RepID=UPI00040592A3|nr:acyltransferase [Vibrio parahaemolyticus]HCE3509555.1 acyltransferase [Vibrio parahaemolyticus]